MLERERNQLRRTVWLAVILSLFIAGILAVSLLYLWARSLTEPLRQVSEAARYFRDAKPQEYDLWLNNLKRVDPRGQTEIFEIKESLLRLGKAIPRLGERLLAGEPQACLTRVVGRALPAILADSALVQQFRQQFRERRRLLAQAEPGQANPSPDDPGNDLDGALARLDTNLSDWGEFAAEPEKEWQIFELTPILQRAWRLATLGLSSPDRLASEIKALPPVWGSPGYLAQAILMLLDYAAGVLPPDGRLRLAARPVAEGGRQIRVVLSKPAFSGEECRELLSPPREAQEFTGSLGPALAAAIAQWQGGDLRAQPQEPEGLVFTLTLPPPPP
jgi:signal transduction histidine kinase